MATALVRQPVGKLAASCSLSSARSRNLPGYGNRSRKMLSLSDTWVGHLTVCSTTTRSQAVSVGEPCISKITDVVAALQHRYKDSHQCCDNDVAEPLCHSAPKALLRPKTPKLQAFHLSAVFVHSANAAQVMHRRHICFSQHTSNKVHKNCS